MKKQVSNFKLNSFRIYRKMARPMIKIRKTMIPRLQQIVIKKLKIT